MVNKSYVATAPGEFNEIKLVQFGVTEEDKDNPLKDDEF